MDVERFGYLVGVVGRVLSCAVSPSPEVDVSVLPCGLRLWLWGDCLGVVPVVYYVYNWFI